jgi:hypothetical protein
MGRRSSELFAQRPFCGRAVQWNCGCSRSGECYRIPQNGPVGGVEVGYNWQWSNWVLGLEADFSVAGMSGTASGTTVFLPGATQTTTAQQETDWYGTVRGRLGWLATPNPVVWHRRLCLRKGRRFRKLHAFSRLHCCYWRLCKQLHGVWRAVFYRLFICNQDRLAGPNGCWTSIGVRRSNINLSIWAPKQCGSQGFPSGPSPSLRSTQRSAINSTSCASV